MVLTGHEQDQNVTTYYARAEDARRSPLESKRSNLGVRRRGSSLSLGVNHVTRGASDDGKRDEKAHRANQRLRAALIGVHGERARVGGLAPRRVTIRGGGFQNLNAVLGRSNVARNLNLNAPSSGSRIDARLQRRGFHDGLLALLILGDFILKLAPRLTREFRVEEYVIGGEGNSDGTLVTVEPGAGVRSSTTL